MLRLLGLRLQPWPARLLRHPEDILCPVLVRILRVGSQFLLCQQLLVLHVERIRDIFEENQPQHHMLVLGGIQVIPQLIRGSPKLRPEIKGRTVAALGLGSSPALIR